MTVQTKANEIKLLRVYEAPLSVVWDAWADPAKAAQWWGPRGFTITNHSKDLRPGGHWTYTMHGPDGVDYPNSTKYLEVVEGSKLVYDHGGNEDRPPMFRVTVLFSESNGGTAMDMTMAFPTPEIAEATRKFIKSVAGDSTWDRFGEYLAKATSDKEIFMINRSFDAPIEQVYNVWIDPAHISKWLPPADFDMQFIKADIKTGGSSFYCMSNESGLKMYGRAEYLELRRPDRIVYTQQFCDENEQLSRHPFAPTWPATMLAIIEFTSEGPNRTRVTATSECHGPTTPEELETFMKARGSMTMGWNGSFDKLEEHLKSL